MTQINPFGLSEVELEGGCREIAVAGELDLAVADRLDDALRRSDADQVLVSLENCQFIDSTGIAVIVRASQQARQEGRVVVVHSPSKQVLRVLELTGLTTNGLVFENRWEAIAATRA